MLATKITIRYRWAGSATYHVEQIYAGYITYHAVQTRQLHDLPCGRDMLAPSTMACANAWSPVSRAYAAAFKASQISLRPSNAGAVSQNSSRLLRSCPSVKGSSLFHLGFSGFRAWFLPIETKRTYRQLHLINTVLSRTSVSVII